MAFDRVGALLEFQQKWGLDDRCVEFLETLPDPALEKVVAKFDHRPDQTNVSARCMAYAKGVARYEGIGDGYGHSQVSPLEAFQQKWGVDQKCIDFLASSSPEVQAAVIDGFDHQPGQTNVSARCFAYARSVSQRLGDGGKAASGGYGAWPSNTRLPPAPAPPMATSYRQGVKRPRGDDTQGNLHQFQRKWGLDDRCMEVLASMPSTVLSEVTAKFTHSPDQTNASARCVAFARSVMKSAGEWHQESYQVSPLEQFQSMWGLDDRCMEIVASLPPEIQTIVLETFDHRPGQTNPSARCMAYAKSVMKAHGEPHAAPQHGGYIPSPLEQFQNRWGVDDRCMEFLASLSPELQTTVLENFDHRADQTNPSARCMAYARSLTKSHAELYAAPTHESYADSPMQQFQSMWGLDDRCMEFLASLAPEILSTVMEKFDHRPDQTNASARCMAYARSLMKSHGEAAVAPPPQSDPASLLLQFQVRWSLDERCMEFLAALSPDVQNAVMESFDHKPDQTNPSARCIAFAKSLLRRKGIEGADLGWQSSSWPEALVDADMGAHSDANWAKRLPQPPPVPQHHQKDWGATMQNHGQHAALQTFQEKWGVDDRCIEFMAGMEPHLQTIVLDSFDHKPGQTNVSARCYAFARSVAQKHGETAGYDQKNGSWAPSQLQQFQEKWGLDERCMELLSSLPEHVLSLVTERFTHTEGQTNVSARCFSFAKSIATKFSGGGAESGWRTPGH